MADDGDDIDWESVRYFLRAAEAMSLSRAARRLRVQHSTVGRRISSLERAVGAPLVRRGPAGLELTPLGRRVFELAGEMGALVAAMAELASVERTNVRLVVPTGFTELLTPRLGVLQREQPNVSLDIVSSARRVDLRKGEADLAIRVGPIEDEGLIARKLGEVGSALYASRGYLARKGTPGDLADLAGHDVIAFHASLAHMPAARWLSVRSSKAKVVMRGREAQDMLAAARAGAGLAVLPCFLGDAEPSLVRLTPQALDSRRISLVYRREARLAAEARSVIAFIIDVMRRHAPRLRGQLARAPGGAVC